MSQYTRRGLLRTGALALPALGRAAARRPNILVVLLDDLGYGQFGPNGDMFDLAQLNPIALEKEKGAASPEAAQTAAKSAVPNLGRLAAEGTRFTDAYVAC